MVKISLFVTCFFTGGGFTCWVIRYGFMPFSRQTAHQDKWQTLVTWPTEGRRAPFKMPFQPWGKKLHIALSKEQLLVFECHMAMGGIGTILSLLRSVTDSHVVHRLHNKAGPWKPTDVIVSHTASGWQKGLLLEGATMCFLWVGVGMRERDRSLFCAEIPQ